MVVDLVRFKSGLFDFYRLGTMNFGVSCCSSWTVSRARWVGALSCWNTYVSPAIRFTPGSKKKSGEQTCFATATGTISSWLNVRRQRSKRSSTMLRFLVSRGTQTRSFCRLLKRQRTSYRPKKTRYFKHQKYQYLITNNKARGDWKGNLFVFYYLSAENLNF